MLSLGLLDELAFECGHLIPTFPTQAMENVLSSSWAEAKTPEIHQETPDKDCSGDPQLWFGVGTPESQEKGEPLSSSHLSPHLEAFSFLPRLDCIPRRPGGGSPRRLSASPAAAFSCLPGL